MLWTLFWYVVSWVATDLLTPAPDIEDVEAQALGDQPFPTASQDRPLPVKFGTCWVEGANTLWHGDIEIIPYKQTECSGTISRKCTTYIAGYFYHLGLQCGLCHGEIDSLEAIKLGDDVIWTGNVANGTVFIDEKKLWGGEKNNGGVQGYVDIQSGGTSQSQNTYMVAKLGADVPAYRGIATVTFNKFYWGMSSTPKKTAFKIKNIPKALGALHSDIGGYANPAHMIYELLTSTEFGSSTPSSLIDSVSFKASAATLYAESFGLRLSWENQMKVSDVIKNLEKIANLKIYPDQSTGKIVMKLIRDDYDVLTVPVLDESNIINFSNFSRSAWFETVNEVRCSYIEDGDTGTTEKSAIAQDLGNLHIQQGERVSTSLNYPQIPTAAIASQVAQTELRQLSYPLAKVTLTVNRDGFLLTPGSVFVLNWPSRGILNQVMRVGKWVEDDISKSTIRIDAVQDIYGISAPTYATPPASQWVAPTFTPEDVVNSREDQLPYMLAGSDSEYAVQDVYTPQGIAWLFAEDPSSVSLDYNLLLGYPGSLIEEDINNTFCNRATLTTTIDQNSVSIDINGTVTTLSPNGDQALGSTVILIGDELLSYSLATDNLDGTFTLTGVERGLLDTVPDNHASTAEVWLDVFSDGLRPVTTFGTTDTVNLKYLTRTSRGVLDEGDATNHALTFTNRTESPYNIGNFTVNAVGYNGTFASGPAVLSWAERNRLTQFDAIATQSAPTVTPEAGTTYTLKIYDHLDVLLRTETGLTGTTYTYTEANELLDNGLTTLEPTLTFVMQTLVGGNTSWQDHSITVNRTDTTPTP